MKTVYTAEAQIRNFINESQSGFHQQYYQRIDKNLPKGPLYLMILKFFKRLRYKTTSDGKYIDKHFYRIVSFYYQQYFYYKPNRVYRKILLHKVRREMCIPKFVDIYYD